MMDVTFMPSEYAAKGVVVGHPETITAVKAEVERLTVLVKTWELMAKGYGKAIESLTAERDSFVMERNDYYQQLLDAREIANKYNSEAYRLSERVEDLESENENLHIEHDVMYARIRDRNGEYTPEEVSKLIDGEILANDNARLTAENTEWERSITEMEKLALKVEAMTLVLSSLSAKAGISDEMLHSLLAEAEKGVSGS
jgi:chromosome segregation ATPase